jgi:hypothetical protein
MDARIVAQIDGLIDGYNRLLQRQTNKEKELDG